MLKAGVIIVVIDRCLNLSGIAYLVIMERGASDGLEGGDGGRGRGPLVDSREMMEGGASHGLEGDDGGLPQRNNGGQGGQSIQTLEYINTEQSLAEARS